MTKQKVLFLKGIPGSGKSTYARELVAKGWKRVNRDDIRNMVDSGQWSKKNEKLVKTIRNEIIAEALDAGHNVVVDDTNIEGTNIEDITAYVETTFPSLNIEFDTKFFDTPVGECIRRDSLRPTPVGKKVIRRMYEKVKDEYFPTIEFNPDLPNCIIVDIDGTLAHGTGRLMYDYTQVHTDRVDEPVAELVRLIRNADEFNPTYVVIVSGRDNICYPETVKWLTDNNIPYDEIYMRDPTLVDANNNKLDDVIIKKDIYEQYIKHRYNVKFVLDDRQRVVDGWRKLGLKVLQVEEGDF